MTLRRRAGDPGAAASSAAVTVLTAAMVAASTIAGCTSPSAAAPDPEPPPPEGPEAGWVELAGNPLLPPRACAHWSCFGTTDPWMARGADGAPRLWFSSGGLLPAGNTFEAVGPVVGRARLEPGSWVPTLEPADAPVLSPGTESEPRQGWDRVRETPAVHWDAEAGRWILWYLGYSVSFFDDPAFGQAVALDDEGTRWSDPPAPLYRPAPGGWDHAFITSPRFIETPSGEWRLYYSGAGTTVGVGLLVSNDRGATWTPHPDNPLFEGDPNGWDQGLLIGSVTLLEGRFYLWYSGYLEPLDLSSTPMSVGLATSDDGIRWTRSPHNPMLEPGPPGSWNDLRIVSPQVVPDGSGGLLLWAHAQSRSDVGTVLGRIGAWRWPGAGGDAAPLPPRSFR